MTVPLPARPARRGRHVGLPMPLGMLVAFGVAFLAVLLIAFFSWQTLKSRAYTAYRISHSLQVMEQFPALLSTLVDAETGQRGFLLTGQERYLDPYNNARIALVAEIKRLRQLNEGNDAQLARVDQLEALSQDKLAELAETVNLYRSGKTGDAMGLVQSDRGRLGMNRIRALVGEMQAQERESLERLQAEWAGDLFRSDVVTWGGAGVLLLLISVSAVFTSRDHRARETESWLRATQLELSHQLQGGQQLAQVSDKALRYLAARLDAQVAAFYIDDDKDGFERVAGYALPPGTPEHLKAGDSLPGQAVKENRTLVVREVPAGYWPVASGVGTGQPRELLVVPVSVHGVVQAVMEFGFFRAVDAVDEDLFARIAEPLGLAIRGAKDRLRLQVLLEETQSQAEELQVQQEELRVGNEELEEQSRTLKESKTQLETQQAELEQINADLEQQTQMLEGQKAALSQSQATLLEKSAELERSNRVKSEFLANMSHELRTPLNSSLILSKLLADNKHGNLSQEQVTFAQTIHGAGNDLLALINDILDLSKIEAGKMDVTTEPVFLARTVDALVKGFLPSAQQKGLALAAALEPGVPEQIDTDPKRLAQILRNLLGNALKFTHSGEVALRVHADDGASVSFSVRDTGIGIAPEHQEVVFEAFRQADGATHRKYGGTGLGLSISRDLARLLGGDVVLQSTPGKGSVFTLTLPRQPAAAAGQAQAPRGAAALPHHPPAAPEQAPISYAPPPGTLPAALQVDDDRDNLAGGASRVILVVEDDTRFATILRDLVREKGFQCVVTHRAGDGIDAARALLPSAVVLDMNLPDYSGLVVLDQLKHDPQTRHIPVHVVSVADYSVAALERGAVGYALKPVKREQLLAALETLESKFSPGTRRVLVVEDDARQMQSIKELLSNDEVEIVGVASAEQALAQLASTRFDCMVMDLNLPDVSGYQLLEDMARRGDAAAPPVIVYTGRSLSRDEEQRLRRHSHSIIIKDARSPERLLGEVTLFLHQVEAKLPAGHQRMLSTARAREAMLEGRRILVVEDDVRNIFALSSVLEPQGAQVAIARNGVEALQALERAARKEDPPVDLVLMDIMMPEMDGFTAIREIRKDAHWRKLPIIALTAKAMKDDQEACLAAGANDYIAKPLDVEKLLSLVRVWMPR